MITLRQKSSTIHALTSEEPTSSFLNSEAAHALFFETPLSDSSRKCSSSSCTSPACTATMSGIEQAVKLCREQIAREIDDLNYKGADTSPCLLLLSDD